ncbi:HNH endonuclease [Longispora albida]|uniref:HNH endonuclease n=1 Tax=Longispora albida TaxID=203523 RepID=UPI0003725715|nr:HNH endonuclease [Longispora albida]
MQYDSKAIVGYAHKLGQGVLLGPSDFSGGEKTVVAKLKGLGFTVRKTRNPDWTRDEVILATELVADNHWTQLAENDPRVIELSALLQSPAIHPLEGRSPTFRNPNGVVRKTADIATRHPSYKKKPTNGGSWEKLVIEAFIDDPDSMRAEAKALKAILRSEETAEHPAVTDPDLDGHSAEEGQLLLRQHLRRERNPRLKVKKLAEARRKGQVIACEVCGFDFKQVYGDHGHEYIECHHRTPLSVTGQVTTKLADLALICSNCHRMIHRKADNWLTIDQLKDIVQAERVRG